MLTIADPIASFLGNWSSSISIGSILLRLVLAILLSFLIGIERSARNHAAGLRTYILVTIGATIAMITNQFLTEKYTGDAARLGAQVISGIGFLGAGTIMITSRSQIRGLTTAAGMWACACMGLAIGVGFYTLALFGGIAIFICLTILQSFESYFKDRSRSFTIHVELKSFEDLKCLLLQIRKQNVSIQRIESNQAYQDSGLAVYTVYLYYKADRKKFTHVQFISDLKNLDYVNYIEEIS